MFSTNDESFLKGLSFVIFCVIVVSVFMFIQNTHEKEKNAPVVETEDYSSVLPLVEISPNVYLQSSDLPIYKFTTATDGQQKPMSANFKDSTIVYSDKIPYVEMKSIKHSKGKRTWFSNSYVFYIPEGSIGL